MRKFFTAAPLLLLFMLQVFTSRSYAQKSDGIRETISVDEFGKKLRATRHAQLIDVRTMEEYNGGHLKHAINIDVNSVNCRKLLDELNRRKPVFVYCLAGKRGEQAADILQQLGFVEIYNMKGGIEAWQKAGKPVIKDR